MKKDITELPPDVQDQIRALEALPEEEIDTSDAPEIRDWSNARRGVFYHPEKQQITLRAEDIEPMGRAIYKKMRSEMEANHWGKMVVIDVKTGDYEIADDDLTATMRLMKKNPDALTWGERVGYPAPYSIS